MAAADYYNPSSNVCIDEEKLEIQAQDIDQRTLFFQARSRGFLVRHAISRHGEVDVAIEHNAHCTTISSRLSQEILTFPSDNYGETQNTSGDKTTYSKVENKVVEEGHGNSDNLRRIAELQARYQESNSKAADNSERGDD